MRKILILFLFFQCLYSSPMAQNTKPTILLKIGDQVPDGIFENMVNYHNNSPKLSDFSGKLVILDFWSTGCSSCIAAFPNLEALQKKFGEKLQIILINSSEKKADILSKIQKYKKYMPGAGLSTLPTVYGDKKWESIFPHSFVPYQVWIDRNGKILSIPMPYNATEEHIQAILEDKKVDLLQNIDFKTALKYNVWEEGLIKPAVSELKPLFYSSFLAYHSGLTGGGGEVIDSLNGTIKRFMFNISILELYKLAFQGTLRNLIETKDKDQFKYPTDYNKADDWLTKNLFSYEISMPLKNEKNLYSYMQSDLNRFFGNLRGIEGKIEQRPFTCYILVKTRDGLIKPSKKKIERYIKSKRAHNWYNYPLFSIPYVFSDNLDDINNMTAFIDESGANKDLDLRVDFQIDTIDFKDVEKVRSSLKRYGFDLLKEQRLLNILVIKDKISDIGK